MKTDPKVAIIILNWNGKEDTIECLESLKHITYPNYEILLVDNGSTDGSVECFRERYPGMEIIENGENLGFAEGNNVGIRRAMDEGVDYVLLLNNDTVVDPEFLGELVKVAEGDEKIGAVQAKILMKDKPELIDSTGIMLIRKIIAINRGYGEKANQYNQLDVIFGPCAAAALYRRNVFERIGMFDERFFAYYEDVDLAIRIKSAGYICNYVPNAIVYHKHSASSGMYSPLKAYFLNRNRILYVFKKSFSQPLSYKATAIVYGIMQIFLNIIRGRFNCIVPSIKGLKDGLLEVLCNKEFKGDT
jgi:GT2 family glycosyltransferase